VRQHHEANGGMSRFDKMPIYLRWAGEEPTVQRQKELCDQFAQLVLKGVIEAPWVPGVEAILRTNPYQQSFILVSATPQDELETILSALDLRACFAEVFGSPIRKRDAIRTVLETCNLQVNECLMIGDALADSEAAVANQVPFLLRRHETNSDVFAAYVGPSVKDFVTL
jgi:phosphoglycolate phosphatase-like HAD superfamily hydrolase